jgi:site-specific DNA-methyltransferase (adenine-specific)
MSTIINGDALSVLRQQPDGFADMCVTSPPYYQQRDYGHNGQIGLEDTYEEYLNKLVEIFREIKRCLRDDGTLWLNIGDSYAGSSGTDLKPKDLMGIPWMLAFLLRKDGWYLRQDIIWAKPSPIPESVTDRCTKSHEYIFLLSKSNKYYFDNAAIRETAATPMGTRERNKYNPNYPLGDRFSPGKRTYNVDGKRNKRDVWTVTTRGYKGAHFATFPPDLIRPCIRAGSKQGGVVIDPFFGAGTVGVVAIEEGREYLGIELNNEYCEIAKKRIDEVVAKKAIQA